MSAVYLAKQAHPSRKVAVKVLLPNATRGSTLHNEFLARFQQEANVIANLEHINIIPIYDYGEQDKLAYLVMPYYPAGSLGHLLDLRGILSLDEMMQFLGQAATAHDHAHAHGVIHRDLKPSNFLLHNDGRLVLADFGIARIMHGSERARSVTLTTAGTIVGTPAYMAPEMALGKQIGVYTDIYELGIVLFEMLNGDVPFKGETVFEIIDQHVEEPLPSLHRTNPAIPTTVDAVLQKATAKKGQDRYVSAQALAQAMRYALSTAQFSVTRPTPLVLPGSASLSMMNATDQTKQQPCVVMSNVSTFSIPRKQLPRPRPGLGLMLVSLCLLVALVLGVGLTGFFAANHQPEMPVVTATSPAQQAKNAVKRYYDSWNRGDYLATYNLLDPGYRTQGGHSYTDELHYSKGARKPAFFIGGMNGSSFWGVMGVGHTPDRPMPGRYRVLVSPVQPSEVLPARNGVSDVHIVSRSGRYSCVS